MIKIEKDLLANKVAVIDSEGTVHAIGRVNEAKVHIKYLLDYLEETYPKLDISKLNVGMPRSYYGYIFSRLGDIIYFNDGKTGMVYFPEEVTDKQLDTMNSLDLGNQKIAICFNSKNNNGKIDFRMVGLEGDYNLKDSMDAYMRNTRGNKSHLRK